MQKKEAELRVRPCAWGLASLSPCKARGCTSAGSVIESWRIRWSYTNGKTTGGVSAEFMEGRLHLSPIPPRGTDMKRGVSGVHGLCRNVSCGDTGQSDGYRWVGARGEDTPRAGVTKNEDTAVDAKCSRVRG